MPAPKPVNHGKGGYHFRCKCESCKFYRSQQERVRHAKRLATRVEKDGRLFQPVLPDYLEHGDFRAYRSWGCRCVPCSEASAEYDREIRKNYKQPPRKYGRHRTTVKKTSGHGVSGAA